MPPRRQAAPKQESKTGLVVALVIFIMLTIALGVTTYLGFDGQKELEAKATAAAADKKKADDAYAEVSGRLAARRIMMGDPFPQSAEERGAMNSNAAFRDELAKINQTWASVGVNWDPKTDTPPESALVVLKKQQEKANTEANNAAAAYQARDKATTDFVAKEQTEVAKTTEAQQQQQKLAKTASDAQKNEQDAKLFKVNEIKQVQDKANAAANKAQEDIGLRDKQIKDKDEKLAGNAETLNKFKNILDAERVKILLTDIKHGDVSRVDTTTDTAFINLGSADAIRPGMTFSVLQTYDRSLLGPEDALPKKATLSVVSILGPKTSRCTIKYASDVNSIKDPVRSGDGVYKPGWKPGTLIRWALAGHFDLNGLGRDETKQLKAILERQGIVVDAYLDLNTLRVVGELNYGIDYLIVGNRPTGETERQTTPERKEAIEKAINDMVNKARDMGIAVMQHRVFLPIAGIDLPKQQALPYFPAGPGGAAGGEKPSEEKKEEKKDEGK
jgi:hypothetical protein